MKIVILVFDNYTALDIVGPYEVLARIPDSEILFLAEKKGIYKDRYGLGLSVEHSIDEISSADVLLIPGGGGINELVENHKILDWVIEMDQHTEWTTSVCTGSLLLGAAGLLKNKKATTYWKRISQLKEYAAVPLESRYIQDGKIITSAGVSAGIDMALFLVSKMLGEKTAKAIQVQIEYDPMPPFGSINSKNVSKDILDLVINAPGKINKHN